MPSTQHLCPGTAKPSRWSRASTQASTPPSSSWLLGTSSKPLGSCRKSVGAHLQAGDKDPPGMGTGRWGPLASGCPQSGRAWMRGCWRWGDGLRLPHPGVKLSCLQGRKGSPGELCYYWDVGFCLGAGILANDLSKVIQASEKLYKLNAPGWYGHSTACAHPGETGSPVPGSCAPGGGSGAFRGCWGHLSLLSCPPCPCRYLVSVMETFLLYKHFQKSPQVPSARQELADFWLGFLLEACQPFVAAAHCPVRGPTEPGVAVPGDHPAGLGSPGVWGGTKQPTGANPGGSMGVKGCGLGTRRVGGLTPQPPAATGPGPGAQQGPAAGPAGASQWHGGARPDARPHLPHGGGRDGDGGAGDVPTEPLLTCPFSFRKCHRAGPLRPQPSGASGEHIPGPLASRTEVVPPVPAAPLPPHGQHQPHG